MVWGGRNGDAFVDKNLRSDELVVQREKLKWNMDECPTYFRSVRPVEGFTGGVNIVSFPDHWYGIHRIWE